jgi:mRNA-degrading endonuclease RelE of RelBE toxin-antitoxin system
VANSSHLNGIFLWVFIVEENARKEFHKLSKRTEKKRKERKKEVCYILQRLDFIVATRLEDEQGSQMGARNQEGFNKEVMEE